MQLNNTLNKRMSKYLYQTNGNFYLFSNFIKLLKINKYPNLQKESNNSFTEMYLQIFKIQTQKPSIPSIKIY